jgi:hypothetical protein
MILKRVSVKNFRAVREAEVELGAHTAILGGNGAGKSTILRAIEKFYASNSAVELDDFFGRRSDEPIEIGLTFTGFSDDELERFGERVQNDEMTVVRVFEAGAGRTNGRYFGSTPQHPAFAEVRAAAGAADKRRVFNEFRQAQPAYGFQTVARADDIEPQLTAWELAHPQDCVLMRDDGQFFGFSNVGRGSLQKSTSFVFIPAVRDASADALDSRGAVIARLMELVVRSAVQRRADVRSFQTRMSDEYRALVDPDRLPELGALAGTLTTTLQDFYAEAGVALRWRTPDELSVPLPTADVMLDEDGFEGPVDRKGHGLQRAFIVTLLQHLARASAAEAAAEPLPEGEPAVDVEAPPAPPYVLPGLILAIEEPELYQHPTKQRHFAKVLARLTDGSLPGVATRTQVMFASHSSLFVSLDRFDEVRLARRHSPGGGADKECRITHSTLGAVAARLEQAFQREAGSFSADVLKGKLHVIGPELAEGFFAELVVLVEGASDRAALIAAAALDGIDFEAVGVAVLPADGKSNIDRPAAIFLELEVPVYAIWDCDAGSAQAENTACNHALQRLLGAAVVYDAETRITDQFASFEVKLEDTLRAELTPEIFDRHLDAVREEFGLRRRADVIKAPFAMTEVLERAAADGARSATLAGMVTAILRKRAG